ncbi:hypothetical protein ES332_D09G256700v1 [Gossypium tomentosum]|uniref:Epidermal patterning factor-like protein n=1 Tax=Gossypium tomentosum TaxID=34277 RepID=A0A5D2JMX7_GOSTO|nr:hypothetical protein ES332_D09G256700v1 [Gossypium tomentosum]
MPSSEKFFFCVFSVFDLGHTLSRKTRKRTFNNSTLGGDLDNLFSLRQLLLGMGVSRLRLRHHILVAFTFLLFASTLSQLESEFQVREGSKKRTGSVVLSRFLSQKQLSGPGSSPPSCRSNCGSCSPCQPVHVPIQPGLVMKPLEYYPEAWRCKCGNNIFMP